MFEQEIERKIKDFREFGIPKYIPREGKINLVQRMVSTIIGARRAGKSFMALQASDELIKQGFIQSLKQVCPIDFDNPVFSQMACTDLIKIQKIFLKLSPEYNLKTPLVFILDEIHKIADWEEYVIDLSSNPYWKVIVTGSSSKLLKGDVATELRGKSISSVVYPLNFSEFLKFKSFNHAAGSTKGNAEILRYFEEYLKWGGYPAITNLEEQLKTAVLGEYFDTMIMRDIIQRYDVNKPNVCIHLYNYLLSNIARPFTLQSVYKYLKESGYTTSRDSIRNYVRWAEDSWLLFTVPIHAKSHKEQERNYKKIYCIDWALALQNSIVWDGSFSRAFENIVYLHLRRNFLNVHYYLTRSRRQEVDFIAVENKGKPISAIQVCMDISDKDTLRRELEPLIATARYFGTKENIIITLDHEQQFNEEGVKIRAIPAWKWLLS